jgi:hypothetical protein
MVLILDWGLMVDTFDHKTRGPTILEIADRSNPQSLERTCGHLL